jgi:hypothetical protein
MRKIAETDCFLDLKSKKYYVFPHHMIFRLDDGIHASPHQKKRWQKCC